MAAQNVDLGDPVPAHPRAADLQALRQELQSFQHVEFSFGYNMEVGDDVVIHRHVLLDDRGGLVHGEPRERVDYANIYSHTHSSWTRRT